MSFAVADRLLNNKTSNTQALVETFVYFADKYPCPLGGYGVGFYNWLVYPITSFKEIVREDGSKCILYEEKREPYNSWGNGSAMRTSAVGWMFDTLEKTEQVAEIQAVVTYNNLEGIKGHRLYLLLYLWLEMGCLKMK